MYLYFLCPINFYLRDASGTVMAIYEDTKPINSPTTNIILKEMPIYGSSRLGQYRPKTDTKKTALGQRIYEFSNHLGNVLVTLTDNKVPQMDGTYESVVVSASDYYPFGMAMSERTYSNSEYRYGFNGKENDTDFGNDQLIQDYGFRLYAPSVVRFFSVDPLSPSYPWYTPYQFAGNTPIRAIDLDGLEPVYLNGEIVSYDIQKGQGFSQIAADLAEHGHFVTWESIMEWNSVTVVGFDGEDVYDRDDQGHTRLNTRVGQNIIVPPMRTRVVPEGERKEYVTKEIDKPGVQPGGVHFYAEGASGSPTMSSARGGTESTNLGMLFTYLSWGRLSAGKYNNAAAGLAGAVTTIYIESQPTQEEKIQKFLQGQASDNFDNVSEYRSQSGDINTDILKNPIYVAKDNPYVAYTYVAYRDSNGEIKRRIEAFSLSKEDIDAGKYNLSDGAETFKTIDNENKQR